MAFKVAGNLNQKPKLSTHLSLTGTSLDVPQKSTETNGMKGKGKAPASPQKPAQVKRSKPDTTDGEADAEETGKKTAVAADADSKTTVENDNTKGDEEADTKEKEIAQKNGGKGLKGTAEEHKGQGESVA